MAIRVAPLDDNLDFPEPVRQRQAEHLRDSATPEGAAVGAAVRDAVANITPSVPLYADAPFTPGSPVMPYFTDSTKAMGLGSSSIDYAVSQFAAAASANGQTYFNGAKFGERWQHQLARLGAVPAILTFPSNTIPASGDVTVHAPGLPLTNLMKSFTGTIAGIPGTLSCDGDAFTFTRTTEGAPVTVPANSPLIPDTLEPFRGAELYLNIGKNNFNETDLGAEIGVINAIHTAYRWAAAFAKRILVIGYYGDTGATNAGEKRRQINAANDSLRKAYGAAFIDLQSFVTSPDIWVRTGVTPTATDLSEQTRGNLPPSLAMDRQHLNKVGNVAFVDYIYERRETLGWNRSAGAQPPVKTYARITSDGFSGDNATTLAGRTTDAALGGAPMAYDAPSASFGISNGQLVGGATTAAGTTLIPVSTPDVAVSMRVPALPIGDDLWLEARRSQNAQPNSGYRAIIRAAGNAGLFKRINANQTQLNPSGTDAAISAGDKVTLEVVGDQVRLLVNDVVRHTIADSSIPSGGHAGFSRTGRAGSTFTADEFTVDSITLT